MQCEAESYLKEAQAKGDKKEVRFWEKSLRKVNKMISEYGLKRYA